MTVVHLDRLLAVDGCEDFVSVFGEDGGGESADGGLVVDDKNGAIAGPLIAADDIRDGARPRRIGPGDVVVITWGPDSTDVEWVVEP